MSASRFEWDSPDKYTTDPHTYVAHVPGGVSGLDRLFACLAQSLHFPDYFGNNWDALVDVIRDLGWIPQESVIIVHHDLPKIDDLALRTYLEVLDLCIGDSVRLGARRLRVVFPPALRAIVDKAMSAQ